MSQEKKKISIIVILHCYRAKFKVKNTKNGVNDFTIHTYLKKEVYVSRSSDSSHILNEINIENVKMPVELFCKGFMDDKDPQNYVEGRYESSLSDDDKVNVKKQTDIMASFVKKSMKHYWNGYKKCAYGFDEVKPCSCLGINTYGGVGMTILENLDTLLIMDMKEELEDGEKWILNNYKIENFKTDLKFTDVVNRVIGSLLSMYSVTYNDYYKTKSIELADRILKIIDNHPLPPEIINLSEEKGINYDLITVKDCATFQVEFKYLSKISSNSYYISKSNSIYYEFYKTKHFGLFPDSIKSSKYLSGDIKFNRFYDYQVKLPLFNDYRDEFIIQLYKRAKADLIEKLIKRSSSNNNKLFVGSLMKTESGRRFNPVMELSYSTIASVFALESIASDKPGACEKEMEIAKSLIYTLHTLHMKTLTKLPPQSVEFGVGNDVKIINPMNELSGDYAEALFLMYQATNDPIFQKWGWDLYLAIEKNSKVNYGYSGLNNVDEIGSYSDITHPEFGAKTLKFLYLLFGKVRQFDIRNYIFNVNGHLFEI